MRWADSVKVVPVLRLGVLACLVLALAIGEPGGDDAAPSVLWLDEELAETGVTETEGGEGRAWADLLQRLASDDELGLIIRRHATAPSDAELELLSAVAGRAPLAIALPEPGTALHLEPPASPRTHRTTAIPFTVYGAPPNATARVQLQDHAGVLDSLIVPVGDDGSAAGAFRLRPARTGWQEWRVTAEIANASIVHGEETEPEAADDPAEQGMAGAATAREADGDDPAHGPATLQRSTGAWVVDTDAPHILVLAGAPTWESRFVIGALEEAGIDVDPVLSLATDIYAAERTALPTDLDDLTTYDAVFLLPGARIDAAERQALEHYVTEQGGGVLLTDDTIAWQQLGQGRPAPAQEIGAADIRWSLPAELAPLPAGDIRSASHLLPRLRPGSTAAAETPDGALLALRPSGFGRLALLGIRETWRWRMEGGHVAEHREFWRSLADWLAAGSPGTPRLTLAPQRTTVGIPVELQLHTRLGTEPPEIRLHRPTNGGQDSPDRTGTNDDSLGRTGSNNDSLGRTGSNNDSPDPAGSSGRSPGQTSSPDPSPDPPGSSERSSDPPAEHLRFTPVPGEPGLWRATVLPHHPGVHTITLGTAAEPHTAFRALPMDATDNQPPSNTWSRLALLAHASGGQPLAADAIPAWVDQWQSEHASREAPHRRWLPWFVLTAALVLALAEWTIRRLAASAG